MKPFYSVPVVVLGFINSFERSIVRDLMNVVFIVLDTTRKDRLSVYNDDIDFTQNLEKFSEDATVFMDAVSQAPWTLPSHASMFTGLYPWEHGATQRNLYLDTDTELLAEKFEKEDYRTACYTANTWISPYTGMADGFQETDNFFGILPSDMLSGRAKTAWRRLNHGRPRWILEKLIQVGEKFHWMSYGDNNSKTPNAIAKAKSFVEAQDDDFFLFLNFMDCHLPYRPPKEYREKHDAPEPGEICQKAHNHNGGKDQADFEQSKKLYDAEVDYLDDQLGELFDYFESEDIIEDTVFVIAADHGENLGEDDMFGHQFSVSEQLVSVPLIIKAPGIETGRVKDQVELRELYSIVPWLADIGDKPEIGTEFARGGYEKPELDLKNIPEEMHDKLGRTLRFVRTPSEKLIRECNGEVEIDTMIELDSGSEIEIDSEMIEIVEEIGSVESGETVEDQDEQVKQRLEELGYI